MSLFLKIHSGVHFLINFFFTYRYRRWWWRACKLFLHSDQKKIYFFTSAASLPERRRRKRGGKVKLRDGPRNKPRSNSNRTVIAPLRSRVPRPSVLLRFRSSSSRSCKIQFFFVAAVRFWSWVLSLLSFFPQPQFSWAPPDRNEGKKGRSRRSRHDNEIEFGGAIEGVSASIQEWLGLCFSFLLHF